MTKSGIAGHLYESNKGLISVSGYKKFVSNVDAILVNTLGLNSNDISLSIKEYADDILVLIRSDSNRRYMQIALDDEGVIINVTTELRDNINANGYTLNAEGFLDIVKDHFRKARVF